MIHLPCVQKNWIFPLKDVRLKTPLDNNQTGPSGRLIVVEGVLRRTSYYLTGSLLPRYGRQCYKEVAVDQADMLQCSDKEKAVDTCEEYHTSTTPTSISS